MEQLRIKNMEQLRIKKRNGQLEELDYDKIHKVLYWSTEGVKNVNVSDIELNAKLHLRNGISTTEIHKVLIESASNLISEETPNYQHVAAKLLMYLLRKDLHGSARKVPHIHKIIKTNVDQGVYDSVILEKYNEEELDTINDFINHDRDFDLAYAGARQFMDKYLIQDRSTNTYYETPQVAYMLIAMTLFQDYKGNKKLQYVRRYYNAISQFKLNLPTPIMCGVRTPNRQYSSCVLIDVADDLDSIIYSDAAISKYTAKRAGIGLNVGRIRPMGSKIRGGEVVSTGVVPFLKKFTASTRCCSQNGVRGGNATVHFPFWHLEIEDLMVLKNGKGSEDNRVRTMDYSIQFNKLFYKRVQEKGDLTLFSPHEVPDLYEAFFGDSDKFTELYEQYEKDSSKTKKTIPALDLFATYCNERFETGRIYTMNTDHCNTHSPYLDSIYMSNLCVAPETRILTKNGHIPIYALEDENVEVWNGINWSNTVIKRTSENQELLKVITSNGEIECTPYHKFYIADGKNYARDKKMIKKSALELNSGDKIIKYNLPIIEGEEVLENAYTIGMHTGDGTYNSGYPYITLYEHKQSVLDNLSALSANPQKCGKRTVCKLNIPKDTKFIVPSCRYTIKSRLEWLAGYIDADGHITKNGIQIKSINKDFILDLKLMLQTLGVNANLTYNISGGGKQIIKGRECDTQPCHRICINGVDTNNLYNLGLSKLIVNKDIPKISLQRDAREFITIDSVERTGRYDKTYCFAEKERGMGIFNGILTGNCQEILEPTTPIMNVRDMHEASEAEIALCVLGGINMGVVKINELPNLCDLVVRGLDFVIDNQDYPVFAAEKMKKRRSIGIGLTNLAYFLAKRKLGYEDPEALLCVNEFVECFQYNLLKASNQLAKENGPCEFFNRTKYSQGILPIDTYCKNVDELINELHCDWDTLRKDILEHGLANSTLSACMPSESCLKWDHEVSTNLGYMNFHEILEHGGVSWEDIEERNLIGWHSLDNHLKIPTKDGEKEVDKVYYNGVAEVYEIEMENGEVVKCTGNHKFLTKNKGWVKTKNLTENDEIIEG
jgi:ribonucleoside-diphosphate reductase alpha chain